MRGTSSAELCARREARLLAKFRRAQLLAVVEPQGEDLELAALRTHEHAFVADRSDRADLPRDLGKRAGEMLTGVEEPDLLAVHQRPGTGSGVAAAHQVVDEVDVIVPADLSLRIPAPALVARLRLVLHPGGAAAAHDEIGSFLQRLDTERKQPVE